MMYPPRWLILLLVLCLPLVSNPKAIAGSCEYGSCHAWIRINHASWQPATIHPRLHPGETFEIIIKIHPIIPTAAIFCRLYEFGTTVYEVTEGPSPINTLISAVNNSMDAELTYYWVIRVLPDTQWINGTAPLEVFTQFSAVNGSSQILSFDVLCAFIEDTGRSSYQADQAPIQESPPYASILIYCKILMVLSFFGIVIIFSRKKDMI